MTYDINDVARRIGIPATEWVGRCYEISCHLVEAGVVEGEAVYGHYLGDVAPDTFFDSKRPFQRHGWIVTPRGTVVDPTRWVFEGVEPYIYEGRVTDEYDRGGNAWRMSSLGAAPEFDPSAQRVDIGFPIDDGTAWFVFNDVFDEQDEWSLTFEQVMYLAHLSPEYLGKHARAVFAAIIASGNSALIPFDNKREVMGA